MLSFEMFRKILASGNFRYVGLHGWGEPMLNPELFRMVEYAESENILTNLTTNGTLLEKNREAIFRSGLRQIAFGIYNKERLLSILPQLTALVKERNSRKRLLPEILVDMTIFRESLALLPELIRMAASAGVDAVILHRIFNACSPEASGKMAYISGIEEKKLFVQAKILAGRLGIQIYLPPKKSFPCRAVRECIFVTVEGQVTPCCFQPENVLGDALRDGLEQVLHSERYRNFVRDLPANPVCSRCLL